MSPHADLIAPSAVPSRRAEPREGLELRTTLVATGSTGFVGRWAVERLGAIGVEGLGAAAITDVAALRKAFEAARPTAVLHLAAQSSVSASYDDPAGTVATNVQGTVSVLIALRDAGFKGRLLCVGTAEAYGSVAPDALPIREDLPPNPGNPYAVSKLAAERLALMLAPRFGFEVLVTRSFNHIGPGQDARFVVPAAARQIAGAVRGATVSVRMGDVDTTRDFLDVRDVVDAYGALLERGRAGEVYNVCSGAERSIRSVVETLAAQAGVVARIEVDTAKARPGEHRRACGDPGKLIAHTGWAPRFAIEDTLRAVLDEWRQRSHG